MNQISTLRRMMVGRMLGFLLVWAMPAIGMSQCITSFPYFEDFESGTGGWSSSSLGGSNSWVRADPDNPIIDTAYSGTFCWITGNNPNVFPPLEPYDYAPLENSAVTSPCFDFTNVSNPGIRVAIWWESQFKFDGCVLQAQKNGGSWETVGNYDVINPDNWYNIDSIFATPGGSQGGWSGLSRNNTGSKKWVIAQQTLEGMGGADSVHIRFVFAADFDSTFDGFAFDDVLIADVPQVELGPDTSICFGDSVVFNAFDPKAVSYRWNTSIFDTLSFKRAALTDEYIVNVFDSLGFIIRDTINLTVSSTFANLGPDRAICPGDTLVLDAGNPGRDYLWLPSGDTTRTIGITQTGTYTINIFDDIGCLEVDSIRIVVDFVPTVDLGPDTNICAGDLVILDAGAGNPGTTYQWNPIAANSQTIQVGAPGQYSVLVTTLANCEATDTVDINVRFSPNVDLGPDSVVCDSFLLDAKNVGSDYLWSTNDTTQTIAPTIGGTYWVQVTNDFGCSNSDTINLGAGVVPIVNLGPDKTVCGGRTVNLSPLNTVDRYLWSTGATTPFIVVGTPAQYFLTGISIDGCTATDTIEVLGSSLNVDLGPDQVICVGDTTLLDAGPLPDLYQWSNNASTRTIEITQAGTYIVTVFDSIGCELQDTAIVSTIPEPSPSYSFTGNRVLFNPVQFTGASTGNIVGWLWDFGDGRTSNQQNPTHTFQSVGMFDVCLTVDNGTCTRTTCQTLQVGLVSIDQAFPGQVKVYPNPTDGQLFLTLDLDALAPVSFQVLDLQGRAVLAESLGTVAQSTHALNLDSMPAGIYLLKLQVGEQSAFTKIWLR